MPIREGDLLGRLRIVRRIGGGGSGTVWLARHEALDKLVAVKTLHEKYGADSEFASRFVREARAAAKLEHPGIVQVHDAVVEGDVRYIVMQYVDGTDLKRRLSNRNPLPVAEAVRITRAVADALQTAHDHGVIHRDVKPSNILLSGDRVFVGDFGLARDAADSRALTAAGQAVGTPHYMSPEQAQSLPQDARSDIYSLGATFYAMLAGRPPYTHATAAGIMMMHVREDVTPPELPHVGPDVARIVERMMAKHPEDRHPTMRAVVDALA